MKKTFNRAKHTKKRTSLLNRLFLVKTKNYTFYVWFVPLVPFVALWDRYTDWAYRRMVWDANKADKVLDKVLPKVVEWVEEDKAFYYSTSWNTSSLWRNAPIRYREWAKKFQNSLQTYIRTDYENVAYIKSIEHDGYDFWIKFEERV